jgi:hypothetical protein
MVLHADVDHTISPPSHESFGTPENEKFHDTKPYAQLDTDGREIRLLKVLPEDRTGQIKCTLLESTPLDRVKGQYAALSYCAGDPSVTGIILVNGVLYNAFANLRHALGEVRHFWAKKYGGQDKDLILWTDQICINQLDVSERSHQVGFMRDIYQHAEQVLVCLSTTKGSPKGMEWLVELAEAVPIRDNDVKPRTEPHKRTYETDSEESENEDTEDVPLDRYHYRRLLSHMWTQLANEKFTRGWLGFYDVIGSPWWNRAWVFQEFVVASEVHFLYRGRFGSWTVLRPILMSLISMHRALYTYLFELNDEYLPGSPAESNLNRVCRHIHDNNWQLLMDTVEFMANSKNTWAGKTGKMELEDLLTHSRYCKATDLRDKVYAFIGLGDKGYNIVPDYSLSLAEVLVDTTRKIIEHEDSLDILTRAVASQSVPNRNLPSWAVDWTQRELGDIRNRDIGQDDLKVLTGLPRNNPNASFVLPAAPSEPPGNLSLAVWGIFLGTLVTDESDRLLLPGAHACFRLFSTAEGLGITCSSAAKPKDQIWVVSGSRSPLVLRNTGTNYQLVSAGAVLSMAELTLERSLLQLVEKAENHQGGRRRILIV